MSTEKDSNFAVALNGAVITSICGLSVGSERVEITIQGDRKFVLFHNQDCCETVRIKRVTGNIEDVIGSSVLEAIETIWPQDEYPPDAEKEKYDDSFSYTDFALRTHNGTMKIRWRGDSNGYYSESVSFVEVTR